jgi:hypothetical protein
LEIPVESVNKEHSIEDNYGFDNLCLFNMSSINENPPLCTSVKINNEIINMQLDSGSSVSVIGEQTFNKLWPKGCNLLECKQNIVTWSCEKLSVKGYFYVLVEHKNDFIELPIVVLNQPGPSILGRNWFKPLNIQVNIECQINIEETPREQQEKEVQKATTTFIPVLAETIAQHTSQDEELRRIMERVQEAASHSANNNEFMVCSDILFFKNKIVLPKSLIHTILNNYHELYHLGINDMKTMIKFTYFWSTMESDIKNKLLNCDQCKFKCQN